jgi:hypothetical protein
VLIVPTILGLAIMVFCVVMAVLSYRRSKGKDNNGNPRS